jgi:flagellar biosynthesis protein FlhA
MAGILILFINIVGGLAVGVIQHGLPIADAMHHYTLLAIGDGLVAQIPSLLLSVATAIIVTRVTGAGDMGTQVAKQLFGQPKALMIAGAIMAAMGVVPGMPNLAFLALATLAMASAYLLSNQQERAVQTVESEVPAMPAPVENRDLSWDDVAPVDLIGLEVGYRLIPLVDRNQGGELMARIKGVRKKISQDLGFLVQAVHIRDNLDLAPNAYRITLKGVPVGEAEIYPEREFAINPGRVFGTLQGINAKDPAFGLEAVWIEPGQREHAQTLGYTVVDASTVIATHLSQLLKQHAHELLGHEEVQQLLNVLSRSAPKLVEDLVPKTVTLGVMVRVLQGLLEEGVAIRDMRTIAETLAEQSGRAADVADLLTQVRIRLSRMIVQNINGMAPELPVIALDPTLEQILQSSVQDGGRGGISLEPGLAERLLRSLADAVKAQEVRAEPAVLLVPPSLRSALAKLARHGIEGLSVLSYNEVPEDKRVRLVATIGR